VNSQAERTPLLGELPSGANALAWVKSVRDDHIRGLKQVKQWRTQVAFLWKIGIGTTFA